MPSQVKTLHDQKLLGHVDPFIYESMQYEVAMGSTAYGTADDDSDIDLYGFCIPPKTWVFPHLRGEIPGFGAPGPTFDNYQKHHIQGPDEEYDLAIYGIVRYFALTANNNPNMLDSLFVPRRCVLYSTNLGERVRAHAEDFVSKQCYHTFVGYAMSMLKKLRSQTATGKRRALIEEHGYDIKAATHLIRLAGECEQLLITGRMDLEKDAEFLAEIRDGQWRLEVLEDYFGKKERVLLEAYKRSDLPERPDMEKLRTLLLSCLEEHYGDLSLPELQDADQRLIQTILEIKQSVHRSGV